MISILLQSAQILALAVLAFFLLGVMIRRAKGRRADQDGIRFAQAMQRNRMDGIENRLEGLEVENGILANELARLTLIPADFPILRPVRNV